MVLANSKVEPEGNGGNDLYYTKVKIKPTGAPAAPRRYACIRTFQPVSFHFGGVSFHFREVNYMAEKPEKDPKEIKRPPGGLAPPGILYR